MEATALLFKTEKGLDEIQHRSHGLNHRLRALLLVVNGRITAGEIIERFSRFGDVSTQLRELLTRGFIRAASAAAGAMSGRRAATASEPGLAEAKRELAHRVHELMGPDGDGIAEKIEAGATCAEVLAYIEKRAEMFEMALGAECAAEFLAGARELLS